MMKKKALQAPCWFLLLCSSLVGCGENGQTIRDDPGNTPAGGGGAPVPPQGGSPGRVMLSATAVTVTEGEAVVIDVIRSDGLAGAVTVLVATRDGTAVQPADYASVNTVVSFADGESGPKRISIPTVDDATDEPAETFFVALSSPTGGVVLGAAREALITIQDNDPALPSAPRAALSASYKRLRIDWTGAPDATTYRVLKDAGQGGLVQVGSDLPASARNFELQPVVHKEGWSRLSYRVEACNSTGCARSEALPAAGLSTHLIGYLKSPDPVDFEWFGVGVALSGDGNTLAVGVSSSQSVYVYTRENDGWGAPAIIAAPAQGLFGFGERIALSEDGNTLAVGVAGEDTLVTNSGAVYVYARSAAGAWSAPAVLKASNPGSFDDFGTSLAMSSQGDVLAVGAPGEDGDARGVGGASNENAPGSGAVYLFRRSGAGWSAATYVKSSATRRGGAFGTAVALSGDGRVLAVGESAVGCGFASPPCADSSGAAYLYATDNWSLPAVRLDPAYGTYVDEFGATIALSRDGTTLAVGAPNESGGDSGLGGNPITDCDAAEPANCEYGAGAVFVYTNTNGNWGAPTYMKASNAGGYDYFGGRLALSADGSTLAVGTIDEDGSATGVDGETNESASDSGAVYVFTRSGSTWLPPIYVKASNGEQYDNFGSAIALSADGNRLVVSAPYEDGAADGFNGNPIDDCEQDDALQTNCAYSSGAVYVY